MSTAPPPADGYTSIQPSGGSYKASSIKEGFTCAGIWAILALFVSGFRLWAKLAAELAHPEKGILSSEEWAQFIGTTVGQFVLMAICLSSVVFYRRGKNVTSFILLDWRWWMVLVILGSLWKQRAVAWLWVGLIYQVRLSRKPKILPPAHE
jgi:hypothetical protein